MKVFKFFACALLLLALIPDCGKKGGITDPPPPPPVYKTVVVKPAPGTTYCLGDSIPAPDPRKGEVALNPPATFIQRWFVSGGPYTNALMFVGSVTGGINSPLIFRWDGGPTDSEMVKPPLGGYTIVLRAYKFEGSSTPGPLLATSPPIPISVIQC